LPEPAQFKVLEVGVPPAVQVMVPFHTPINGLAPFAEFELVFLHETMRMALMMQVHILATSILQLTLFCDFRSIFFLFAKSNS